ncbi:663_t:CDS:2, partial [Funneliformis caledonium]
LECLKHYYNDKYGLNAKIINYVEGNLEICASLSTILILRKRTCMVTVLILCERMCMVTVLILRERMCMVTVLILRKRTCMVTVLSNEYCYGKFEGKLHSSNSVKVENSMQKRKHVKFTIEEPEDENSNESKNSGEKDINKNVDWKKWLENVLERKSGINKIIDVLRHVMSIDEIERDWIVNKISLLFTFLQATFTNKILFHWIEHNIEPTHERLVAENNSSKKGRMKADIVGVRLSDGCQVVFLEMSGAPTDFLNTHT